ncbi:sulfatase [Natrinema salsiterrestre]|uniref:Sulfatase n=1 Tax=Natrinema salsiterrestre TaxID=2950540 RepID=A0A9Q4Q0E8_9EURY|nr:sulfatase [Natrinema salsiterrestre]MDF9744106.1 sulfatase [Natrinema salsiterrestre]
MSRPNILLVVLDSANAKHTGIHGYERNTTPFLESFRSRATTYTQARSPGMTSLPSHTSIFTGLSVAEHGVHDLLTHQLKPGATIWEQLRDEYEYTTGVFSDNVNLTGDESLRFAFDHAVGRRGQLFPSATDPDIFFNSPEYLDGDSSGNKHIAYLKRSLSSDQPLRSLANGAAAQFKRSFSSPTIERLLDQSAERFVDPFLSWTDSVDGPWAACLNLMDTHVPFYPKTEHDDWGGTAVQRMQARMNPNSWKVYGGQHTWEEWTALEDLYDGTIKQADHHIKRLMLGLEARDQFDDTLVVITSDHGEGFGEQSRVRPDLRIAGHIVGLHEALLHVPLVVSYPGQETGREYDDLATLQAFPDVVESVVQDEWSDDGFVADDPVLVSGSTIDKKAESEQRAGKYCENTDRFEGDIRTVYREEDGTIRKYLTWDDDGVVVDVFDAHTAETVTGSDPRDVVQSEFSQLENAGVVRKQDSASAATLNHLEDLGYV